LIIEILSECFNKHYPKTTTAWRLVVKHLSQHDVGESKTFSPKEKPHFFTLLLGFFIAYPIVTRYYLSRRAKGVKQPCRMLPEENKASRIDIIPLKSKSV
jgi:hypothetical protein